ncbi:MAG: GtrA family protein, partial [Deltaproteobacteria bacterium]|nr:GtrA family protein [Deltaproteobacteria bacterium]
MNSPRQLLHRFTTPAQRRFIKFCVVGGSGVPVNLFFTWIGHAYVFITLGDEWRKAAAFFLGIMVSIFTNFLLNDLWTWSDRDKSQRGFMGRLARFYLVCSVAAGIQFGVAMALSLWLQWSYLLAQLVGIVLATMINFVANNLWTFAGS